MNTTLHIPIKKELKEQAEAAVKEQGYSSLQEAIRVLVASLAKGEIKTAFIHTDAIHYLTQQQERSLAEREKETRDAIKKRKAHVATTVSEMMSVLEDTSHKHD